MNYVLKSFIFCCLSFILFIFLIVFCFPLFIGCCVQLSIYFRLQNVYCKTLFLFYFLFSLLFVRHTGLEDDNDSLLNGMDKHIYNALIFMVAKNEFKQNLRITNDILNKITLPIILLDLLSITNYIKPNCN